MSTLLQNPTFVLFAILFTGLALGNISIKGVSLGASGVLFTALLAGHLKLHVPQGLSEVGTAFFVYAVGLGVGNRFFLVIAKPRTQADSGHSGYCAERVAGCLGQLSAAGD